VSKEQENKAIAVRWLEGFWGRSWTPKIVDDLAADHIVIQFSLQTPCRGPSAAKNFLLGIREIFQNLEFHVTADLVTDGEYVIAHLEGVALTLERRSSISSSGYFRRARDERCISRERPRFGSRTARS
jgi:hypothetical protein